MTIPRIYMTEAEQELVRRFLRHLRSAHTDELVAHMNFNAMNEKWTTQGLHDALAGHAAKHRQLAGLRLHKAPSAISFGLRDYGDQPVTVTVSDEEVHVSTPLCEQRAVKDAAAFNEACLRLGPVLPLSNVGLVDSHYVLFGQLSAHSPLANVIEELDVLGQNATLAQGEFSHLIR